MKLLTLNFLTCARKTCKSLPAAFPLRPREAELERIESDLNALFLRNILTRVDWEALKVIANELGLPALPAAIPEEGELFIARQDGAGGEVAAEGDDEEDLGEPSQVLKDLHVLLMETSIENGKLVCGNCGHEYAVKEGIANFLLPSHLV